MPIFSGDGQKKGFVLIKMSNCELELLAMCICLGLRFAKCKK